MRYAGTRLAYLSEHAGRPVTSRVPAKIEPRATGELGRAVVPSDPRSGRNEHRAAKAPNHVVPRTEGDHPGDREIRGWLLEHLRATPDVRVVQELGLLRGEIRADIAVISSRLHGFEIKSRHDSLERLPRQRAIYNRVFDWVTLVTCEHHLKRARRMIPGWWGIWEVVLVDGVMQLVESRPPTENPSVDVDVLAQLLWKDELVELLRHSGGKSLERQNRRVLRERLVESLPQSVLRSEVARQLRRRENWRADS